MNKHATKSKEISSKMIGNEKLSSSKSKETRLDDHLLKYGTF